MTAMTPTTDRDLLDLIAAWDGQGVVVRHDPPTGSWIFIALHDATLGRPTGGTRMKVYPTLADGLRDAQRLAEGMTYKWAGVGLPFGGGKAVLAIPRPLDRDEREGLWRRYADFLESLRGAFATGADLGTGPEAMALIARRTRWVMGAEQNAAEVDPGPFTARGVFYGLRAAVAQVFGSSDLTGRSVLVEGLGGVGLPLARQLADAGARLLLADLDAAKAETLAAELGAEAVPLEKVVGTAVDVYAPCAIGATLNAEAIPRLACRLVAGSANNQLAEEADAERLEQRGILYVPDYVINAGGAVAIAMLQDGESDHQVIFRRVEGLGDTVAAILAEAAEEGITPLAAARRRVDRLLAEKRAS